MKDIVFAKGPSINSFKGRIQAHVTFNSKVEEMKNAIGNASTIQSAVDILLSKFGCEELLYIIQAIKEVFQINREEIKKYL